MGEQPDAAPNAKQAVPFFGVSDIAASLRFYVDGLGLEKTKQWIDEAQLRWCWLQLGGAALTLQEFPKEGHDAWTRSGKLGEGVTICFFCQDAPAIFREARARGLKPSLPFVGNRMWVTGLQDPDGYRLDVESKTDAPEESLYVEPGG